MFLNVLNNCFFFWEDLVEGKYLVYERAETQSSVRNKKTINCLQRSCFRPACFTVVFYSGFAGQSVETSRLQSGVSAEACASCHWAKCGWNGTHRDTSSGRSAFIFHRKNRCGKIALHSREGGCLFKPENVQDKRLRKSSHAGKELLILSCIKKIRLCVDCAQEVIASNNIMISIDSFSVKKAKLSNKKCWFCIGSSF